MMEPVRIGTAGWSIPAACRHLFPGDGMILERYAKVFNAVEINTSFYRPHRQATYARWAGMVPGNFSFAVKAPREITHVRRLRDVAEPVIRFADEVSGLGSKLGAVLVQMPPSLGFDPGDAARCFECFNARLHAAIVCEPRHPGWFTAAAEALLLAHGIARVAADPAPAAGADEPGGSRATAYFRLHGSPRIYYSDYGAGKLEGFAARIAAHRGRARGTWCIFDNTAEFAATGNALTMMRLAQGG